jgi:adenosine deaminase
MMTTTPRSLATLPKAHLHVHLEGAMRRSTLLELCRSRGTARPNFSDRYGTFADFQELYVAARHSIRSIDDLVRLVGEVVADAAADGAVWIEPAVHLPGHRGLGTDDEILDVLLDAGRQASEATGVGVGWLLSSDRTLDPELAVKQAMVAARRAGDGVVSFGLANDEAAGAPERFATAFAVARAAGLISAPHAGEHGGPDSVRGAVDSLGADRIQHGVRCVEDPTLVRRLADEQVCLDVCPTSNVSLSVVPSLRAHPLLGLVGAGVPCSINADDPLLFGVGLLDEYVVARNELGLDDHALASCASASLDHSGAPADVKAKAHQGIDQWLRS